MPMTTGLARAKQDRFRRPRARFERGGSNVPLRHRPGMPSLADSEGLVAKTKGGGGVDLEDGRQTIVGDLDNLEVHPAN